VLLAGGQWTLAMKHSVNELLEIAYRFYPRDMWTPEVGYKPGYDDTEEHRRLVAARRQAGAEEEPWRAMLRRLNARFPECSIQNQCLHLLSGSCDACYSAWLWIHRTPEQKDFTHCLAFWVSFVVPYYVIYSSRWITLNKLDDEGKPEMDREIRLDLSPDEQPYGRALEEEIKATFGSHFAPMPPEVGKIIVPDVVPGLKILGEATLYDCLFSDAW
jgi:hypothetical protein